MEDLDALNTTLQQIAEKNERIRARLQGNTTRTEPLRGADVSSRLSYGTWSTQDFLSSTRLSTSAAAPKSSAKKTKVIKKFKKKIKETIQYSSEEEESQSLLKVPPRTKKVTKKGADEPSTSKLPKDDALKIRSPLTIRNDNDSNHKQHSAKKTHGPTAKAKKVTRTIPLAKPSRESSGQNKTESSEASTYPDTTNSSRGLNSSSLSSVSSIGAKPMSSTKKKTSVKKKPIAKKKPAFVAAIEFSSDSGPSDCENKFAKVQELRKKVKEGSLLRNFPSTSSESSANGSITKKLTLADQMGSGLHLKRFVMDSDSEDEPQKNKEAPVSKENVVADTMDPEIGSEESVDEAFVTIPCSQDTFGNSVTTEKNKKRISDQQKHDLESEQESERSDLIIPDSQSPENEESPQDGGSVVIPCSQEEQTQSPCEENTATPDEHLVTVVKAAGSSEESESLPARTSATGVYFVPDSEAPDSEESNKSALAQKGPEGMDVVNDDIHTVPNSQLDAIPEDSSSPESQLDPTQCDNTPSLVNRLVSLVRSVSSSPAKLLFGSSPANKETVSQLAEPESEVKTKKGTELAKTIPHQTPKQTPRGNKFFEMLQYSSEEESLAESCISVTKSSSDQSSVHDSSLQSQLDRSDINDLSQRLQQVLLKSTKKKKLTKGKKKAVPKAKPPKKPTYSNTSEDSSFEGRRARRVAPDVTVPESQSCRTDDDVSVIGDSQGQNVLASNTESLEVEENGKIPDFTIPDSQQTNLELQMSVSRSGTSSLVPTQETTVRYNPPISSGKKEQPPLSDEDEDLSPEIPYCGPQARQRLVSPLQRTRISDAQGSSSTDEFHLDQTEGGDVAQPQMADMSLQVSLLSPANDSDTDSVTSPNVPNREISIQVSMIASESDDNTLESSPEKKTTSDDGEGECVCASENDQRANVEESMETDDSTPSPPSRKVASFSAQVSIRESPESPMTTYGQRVSYDGGSFQDKSQDISTEISGVAKNLRGDLEQEQRDGVQSGSEEEKGQDGGSSSGSEDEDYESADEEGGQLQNMSLQVSMCFESRSPDQIPDMEGSIVDLSSEDEQPPPPPPPPQRKATKSQERDPSPPESPDIQGFSDDSDADPDFHITPPKKTTKKTPRKPKGASATKTRKKTKSGGSKSGEEKENLPEAQTIKTVLLCEKKESVTGVSDDMDDDFTLPDLSPPRLPPPPARKPTLSDDSSEDDFDAYLERLRTPANPQKPTKSMDNFIVEDDEVSSGEEFDDNTSVFYARTDREIEKTPKNRERDDRNVFKTPNHLPSRTPQPGPSRVYSKTPAPSRLQSLASNTNNVRPHSTGHLPQFYGFLKSLSANIPDKDRHPEAKRYVSHFKKEKETLSQKLFKLYNESVFDKKLPEDLNIKWNSRLLTTAGFCAYKRDKTVPSGRVTRIELSVKVCDSAERVRDTLIHELCHAAVWQIFGKNDGHGRYWQSFAQKATRVHNDLPAISRCHMYDINHKFIYKCTKCGQQIGRHTKSLNTDKKVCGICHGKFEVHINTPNGLTPQKARTPRPPNKFALFVKENYNVIKQRTGIKQHADVMKALSAEFSAKAKVGE